MAHFKQPCHSANVWLDRKNLRILLLTINIVLQLYQNILPTTPATSLFYNPTKQVSLAFYRIAWGKIQPLIFCARHKFAHITFWPSLNAHAVLVMYFYQQLMTMMTYSQKFKHSRQVTRQKVSLNVSGVTIQKKHGTMRYGKSEKHSLLTDIDNGDIARWMTGNSHYHKKTMGNSGEE